MTETVSTEGRVRRARWIAGAVVAVLAVLTIVLALVPSSGSRDEANPLVGKPAPAFQGVALDGRPVDTANLRGRWTVVNFFASWCIPCRQEHPELIEFNRRNTAPGAPALIAVVFDRTDVDAARTFFQRQGGDWPVVPDENGGIAVGYGVRGLPETFVVAPDGRIAARIKGAVTADALQRITGVPA